jgi:hypothetical protein
MFKVNCHHHLGSMLRDPQVDIRGQATFSQPAVGSGAGTRALSYGALV